MTFNRRSIRTLSVAFAMLFALSAMAVSQGHFATSSKLATGKWVKLKIIDEGIYQLSDKELAGMGFSDPTSVKIFGYGGVMLSEGIDNINVDDITQIPTMSVDNKIYFYAVGALNVKSHYGTVPYYDTEQNAYSSAGYYFITDDAKYTALNVPTVSNAVTTTKDLTTSYGYYNHELDICSMSTTGKIFFGEDITNSLKATFPVSLPGIVAGTSIYSQVCVGAKSSSKSFVGASLNGETIPLSYISTIISPVTNEYAYYYYATATGSIIPATSLSEGSLTISLTTDGVVASAKIDKFILTYTHSNAIPTDSAQMKMGFNNLASTDRIVVQDATPTTIAWNVNDVNSPIQYAQVFDEASFSITPRLTKSWAQFVLFDTAKEQKHIVSYESVSNQNLHGMTVPDMVILTSPQLSEQAQRIADMHHEKDGLDVAIITEQDIFNEFSSGTPDVTAIRMFMKMLYNRDPNKFRYLLLFGNGSYDNRHLMGNKSENLLLTFQSTPSNNETTSYTTDDYYGFLKDNSGYSLAAMPLCISIGRMPVTSVAEATSAVDKLLKYVNTPDYGAWRNDALIVADAGDSGLHMYQAEGVEKLLSTLAPKFNINKIYNEAYPLTDGEAVSGRLQLAKELDRGQLFVSYIGHGGPQNLTKSTKMWRKEDAKSKTYRFLPFFSFATCDVARFDSGSRGIAEEMFHTVDGGMIAGMASTRSVYADDNNRLNINLITSLFTLNEDGSYPTIGEAFMKAKQLFTTSNANKLNFILLGDPAMRLNYPKNRCTIDKVGNEDITGTNVATIYPQTSVAVSGTILNEDGQVDTGFNGSVTVMLYDKKIKYKTLDDLGNGKIDSYLQQEQLAQSMGNAVNGTYSVTIAVPAECMAQGEAATLRVYAHKTSDDSLVDGVSGNIVIAPYDEAKSEEDVIYPVIESIYLNDESFADGDAVLPTSTLHITVTDDKGLNVQSRSFDNGMRLVLDGGKTSYANVANYLTLTDSGRKGYISMPITNHDCGLHSLQFTAADVAGNKSSEVINFFVQEATSTAQLSILEKAASATATFLLDHSMPSEPTATIYVIDSFGKQVWSGTTSSFPYEWNLCDSDNKRVEPGIYRCYATFSTTATQGSTPLYRFIVLK